jgi:hypothetical protein
MLMIMGVVEHPERRIAVFDKTKLPIGPDQHRRIVARIRKDKSSVRAVEDPIDPCNELMVVDRIPK